MIKIVQFFIMMILGATLLSGAPARGGLHTYRQADGSTFQATLHGDAAFHWMESNGEVILFNPQDKNYYNASLSSEGKFVMSKQKVGARVGQNAPLRVNEKSVAQILDSKKRAALQRLQRASRQGSHPQ